MRIAAPPEQVTPESFVPSQPFISEQRPLLKDAHRVVCLIEGNPFLGVGCMAITLVFQHALLQMSLSFLARRASCSFQYHFPQQKADKTTCDSGTKARWQPSSTLRSPAPAWSRATVAGTPPAVWDLGCGQSLIHAMSCKRDLLMHTVIDALALLPPSRSRVRKVLVDSRRVCYIPEQLWLQQGVCSASDR